MTHRPALWLLILAISAGAIAQPPAATEAKADAVAAAEAKPEKWLRLTETDDRVMSLEIASKEFHKIKGTGPTITLYGAVHIAEPRFYATLQQELDAYDLVLFEGVNGGEPVGEEAPAKKAAYREPIIASLVARPDPRRKAGSTKDKEPSDGLQARMAKALGLTFQLDQMDHDRPNWRNSDMSIDEIEAAVKAQGGDASQLLGMLDGSNAMAAIANTLFALIENIPGGSERGRLMIMHMLPEADDLMGAAVPGGEALMKVIIEDRNQRVIDDLTAALKDKSNKRIAVIYGAGHMGDLTQRMEDQLGFAPGETEWHPAMSLNLDRAGISKSEQMMTRIAIKRQVFQMKKMAERTTPDAADKATPEPVE